MNAKNKGTCDNHVILNKKKIEKIVLDGLRNNLMDPALVEEFVAEFHKHLNELGRQQDKQRLKMERELIKNDKETDRLIDMVVEGTPPAKVKDRMWQLEKRNNELKLKLERHPKSLPRLHPNLAKTYRDKVAKLAEAITAEGGNAEAFNAVRNLIQEIRVIPNNGNPQVELFGELPALLALANKNPASRADEVFVSLVAGARFSMRALRVLCSVLRPRTVGIARTCAIPYTSHQPPTPSKNKRPRPLGETFRFWLRGLETPDVEEIGK